MCVSRAFTHHRRNFNPYNYFLVDSCNPSLWARLLTNSFQSRFQIVPSILKALCNLSLRSISRKMVEQNCQWHFWESPFKRWHELCTTREGDMCNRKSFCCVALHCKSKTNLGTYYGKRNICERRKKHLAQEKYIGESYKHNWLEIYI